MSGDSTRIFSRSLHGRLFAATFTASIVAVGIALLVGILATRSAVRDSYKREVLREATIVASRVAMFGDDAPVDRQRPPMRGPRDGAGLPPVAGSPGAGPIGSGRGGPAVLPKSEAESTLPVDAAKQLLAGRTVTGKMLGAGGRRLYAAVPVEGQDAFVFADRPDRIAAGDSSRYLTGLVIAALIAAAISALAALLLSRRLTRPIAHVVAATVELASGRTPKRIDVPETQELAELAYSFNHMADQLARARDAERTVLMSASHELRTPLTAISGYAEGIEDGTIDVQTGARVIVSESSRLERLVQDLLVLARLDQGTFETHSERVALDRLIGVARDRLALRAQEGRVTIIAHASPDAVVTADADRVLQVITNLVDNAIRVSPAGGTVTIAATPGQIVVTDSGPGFLDEDLPHVFERFHLRKRRGMGSPDGSGIGLAITDELTRAMGGHVTVENHPDGGACFVVSLPLAEAVTPQISTPRPESDSGNETTSST